VSAATGQKGSRRKYEHLHHAPSRISLYEEGGKTILASLKPIALLAMFNVPQLERVAQEVEESIIKIMNETAKG
jgi:hypothetical protein